MKKSGSHTASLVFAAVSLVSLALTQIPACGPPHQIVNRWKDPEYPKAPLRNVLVIVMKHDDAIRRLWEDEFVTALHDDGVQATPSYRLFPQAIPDTQSVISAVRKNGFDGVIVTRRLPDETQSEYVPPTLRSEPVTRFNPWLQTFYTDYADVYEPGYTENSKVVRHRTDVWTTGADGHLVWSATSEVIDPSSTEEANRYVTKMVVPDLKKAKVT